MFCFGETKFAVDFSFTLCSPAWLNNCVGHRNHRHFFLFCVYMCIGCFYVSMSGYPLFKEHFYGTQVFQPLCWILAWRWRKTANLCLCHWTPMTAFVGHQHVPSAANQHTWHVLAIAHLLLLDLEYGTVCQPSCESQTLHSDNFDEHSKRICLVTDSCSAEWQFFSCAVYKLAFLVTYLFT